MVEFDINKNSSEEDIIKLLWETMDVREILMSIVASGFFQHEPVIVIHEDNKCEDKEYIVIEGNRRLAAVKILLDPEKYYSFTRTNPYISSDKKASLEKLPVIFSNRKDAWQFLGFKHVNGPAKWSSYAKSRYIADVHRKFGISLEEIAKQIGDTHRTTQRLFRGLMVIEQAERLNAYRIDERWQTYFSLSQLYTGLSYSGISEFLALRDVNEESDEPVPVNKIGELRELLVWLYGSKTENKEPVIHRQNPHLRLLEAVVQSKEGLATLRSTWNLEYAYRDSRPSDTLFEEAITSCKRYLELALSKQTTGYDGSNSLLGTARILVNLSHDLYDDMLTRNSPRQLKRIREPVDV